MLATLTSKGQITLPKEIRDQLGLDAGSMLDFELRKDKTVILRQVAPDARRIRGLLQSPAAPATPPLSPAQMDEAVSLLLVGKQAAARAATKGRRS
jgi:antitoxin PrlF